MHIALATAAEVDLLVSWNFRHIVHYEKIRLFNAVNLERGYKPLQIYSPGRWRIMEKTEIRAVELTRQIRAAHAEQLRDATFEKRIRCYRSKAQRLETELQPFLEAAEAASSGAAQRRDAGDEGPGMLSE